MHESKSKSKSKSKKETDMTKSEIDQAALIEKRAQASAQQGE